MRSPRMCRAWVYIPCWSNLQRHLPSGGLRDGSLAKRFLLQAPAAEQVLFGRHKSNATQSNAVERARLLSACMAAAVRGGSNHVFRVKRRPTHLCPSIRCLTLHRPPLGRLHMKIYNRSNPQCCSAIMARRHACTFRAISGSQFIDGTNARAAGENELQQSLTAISTFRYSAPVMSAMFSGFCVRAAAAAAAICRCFCKQRTRWSLGRLVMICCISQCKKLK